MLTSITLHYSLVKYKYTILFSVTIGRFGLVFVTFTVFHNKCGHGALANFNLIFLHYCEKCVHKVWKVSIVGKGSNLIYLTFRHLLLFCKGQGQRKLPRAHQLDLIQSAFLQLVTLAICRASSSGRGLARDVKPQIG